MEHIVIERYEAWLKRGWEWSPYFPDKLKWEQELTDKINQLKNIK